MGLTQEQFSERYGLTRGQVGSYESGVAKPRIDVLLKIAEDHKVNLTMMLKFKMTAEKFHHFIQKPLSDPNQIDERQIDEPPPVYGNAEEYELIRAMENADLNSERVKIGIKLLKLCGRLRAGNKT